MEFSALPTRHRCRECDPSWKDDEPQGGYVVLDGAVIRECPMSQIDGEAWEMVTYASDWELGHSPVTMGRARWLPTQFVQAMHAVRTARGRR